MIGLLTAVLVGGCPSEPEPMNMLPTTTTQTGSGDGSGPVDTGSDGPVDGTADDTAGPGATFPATYRFDCIDIIELGDGDMDGQPDGESFQATLLEDTWAADINNFKLNVMLTVRDRDDAAGMATVVVGSGVGGDAAGLCTEPTTAGSPQTATYEAGAVQWQPSAADGVCAEAATGTEGGTYSFEISPTDTIYVYAEDDDGTVFNCVPAGGSPNAVPLHAVRATVTVDANEQIAAGQLTGCLVDSEAQGLCSCLGVCGGIPHPDCGGCPDGAVPLAELLGSVGPTDGCTDIMGETAYDLTVGFTTVRLAADEPMLCG